MMALAVVAAHGERRINFQEGMRANFGREGYGEGQQTSPKQERLE